MNTKQQKAMKKAYKVIIFPYSEYIIQKMGLHIYTQAFKLLVINGEDFRESNDGTDFAQVSF